MSLAADARDAVREHPFLHEALAAGVLNYTAAARYLDVDGDSDAVATALRRYAEELPDPSAVEGRVRVSMERGVGPVEDADEAVGTDGTDESGDPLLAVGGLALAAGTGSLTAVVATGDVGALALRRALGQLATRDVDVVAAGVGADALVVAVDGRAGADALRAVEAAVEV